MQQRRAPRANGIGPLLYIYKTKYIKYYIKYSFDLKNVNWPSIGVREENEQFIDP